MLDCITSRGIDERQGHRKPMRGSEKLDTNTIRLNDVLRVASE